MEWYSERIVFIPEWNNFCFRKDLVKQKPGERKGGRKERKRKRDRGRKEEKERGETERKVNVSTDVVNYPMKQLSLKSKNRNRNSLSHILIAFDGTKNKKTHLHITV